VSGSAGRQLAVVVLERLDVLQLDGCAVASGCAPKALGLVEGVAVGVLDLVGCAASRGLWDLRGGGSGGGVCSI
jgi:hypothetical protein